MTFVFFKVPIKISSVVNSFKLVSHSECWNNVITLK